MSARNGQCAMAALAAEINCTVVAEAVQELQMGLMGADFRVVAYLARASHSTGNSGYAVGWSNYIAVCRSYCCSRSAVTFRTGIIAGTGTPGQCCAPVANGGRTGTVTVARCPASGIVKR